MFDMDIGSEQANVHDADLKRQITRYIDACRQWTPEFVGANYSWRGAIKLNRLAWGVDIIVTPYNFIMGLPNFGDSRNYYTTSIHVS